MDKLSTEARSKVMGRIRSKNTAPELAVRSMLHSMGYRFRLHRRDLPGKPDIVLPKLKKIVLVHGCYWHGHECHVGRAPKSNLGYWLPKIERNRQRDRQSVQELTSLGWSVLEVWECETRKPETLRGVLAQFMS